MAARKQVLGAAHVKRASKAATGKAAVFQDLITRYVWEEFGRDPSSITAPAGSW